jgi:integrase
MAFTDRSVRGLRADPEKTIVKWEPKSGGFGIRVSPKGKKSFIAMTRIAPAVRGDIAPLVQVTLGHYPRMSLAEARKKFHEVKKDAALGVDLRVRKRGGRSGVFTVADLFDAYLTQWLEPHRRASSVKVTKQLMKLPLARWGNRPAHAVSKADVIALHDEIAANRRRNYARFDGGAVVQADHVLAIVRSAYRYGIGRGTVEKDPTEGIKKRSNNKPRDRVLSDAEIVAFWHGCGDALEWPFQQILRLLLLTGQRAGEVTGMCWQEFDRDYKTWTIPAERAKNGKEHIVHLSPMARAIIRTLPHVSDTLVFTRDGKSAASYLFRPQKTLDAAMADRLGRDFRDWTPHDLRRTAASGMAGLGIAPHVVDKILNHVSGTIRGVAAIYNRHEYLDDRKAALERWGTRVERLVGGKAVKHRQAA